ncbi:MAG: beta-N-acetylhexosaminidase [Reichenbachiella sp.]|uniref:beta-N-acetylhexosaminidase n=1 Tax=Reichenbachiella sp. TaxID=2184521 RepID=UPI003265264E
MLNLESKFSYAFYALILMGLCIGPGCEQKQVTNLADHTIIPHPVKITASGGSFLIDNNIIVSISDGRLSSVANYLSKMQSGLKVSESEGDEGILLSLNAADSILGDEGYHLRIEEDLITISAYKPQGVFNGVQTLLQLIPVDLTEETEIATGVIKDYPRYSYRGSMLDVSRHFFGVEEVKRYIDFLAVYKMNTLHLHLTDDQGWRIEIKAKPELTAIGSTSEVGEGSGGYYTQEQYREIVQYAADRFITIVPEIDMPGHTQAALASYPELNCNGKPGELYRGTEVGFSTLCTDKESTYEFVEAVIQELASMTPGEYIHIGGDESHVTEKEDYIYFINRVQKIVSKYGKTMIGWDEIAQANIESSTIVQQWNSAGNATKAAKNGNKVLLSPAKRAYLDMKYDSTTRIGLAWASLIEVDHGYNWNPDTVNAEIPTEAILGIEAPLWTETVENMKDIEYMIFPRLLGYAEIGWSPQSTRVWSTYKDRLANHAIRLDANEINFYRSPLVEWRKSETHTNP